MLRKPGVVPTKQRLLIDCKKYSKRTKGNCVLKYIYKQCLSYQIGYIKKEIEIIQHCQKRNSKVKSITKMKILLRGA